MIVCTGNDKEFELYKGKIKDKKVKFHIKDIFRDHWENYKIKYANRKRRPIIDKVVNKFLKCKTFLLGYSIYTCSNCDTEKIVPNPILIRNRNNIDVIAEKTLQKLILEDIENFMKELGNSFSFIGSEYKIKIGDRYNYIDLLLYNIKFKCYTVVELKITELKKEHIGQIQTYMNYIDKHIKTIEEDKTIGIIICRKDNKYIMEYCSDDRILSKEYELV